jgi:hypothetical protein
MLRITMATGLLALGCSAEAPSATLASALAPSCQVLDAISADHRAKVESAATASYQAIQLGASADIGGESRVDIRFSPVALDSCSSIQRTAVCFAGLAGDAAERREVQAIWAPLVETICAPASPSPDLVIPPSAASLMVPP